MILKLNLEGLIRIHKAEKIHKKAGKVFQEEGTTYVSKR